MEKSANSRMEIFSDGVFAIALTLLIIEIKIPASEHYNTNAEFWLAIRHLLPTIFAFLLSFITILITWVNHHNASKLVTRSSPPFIYANGLLLLTVVFVPFPTSLLGENILTDHATPAVVIYCIDLTLQGLAWNLIGHSVLKPSRPLTKNEQATIIARQNLRNSYYAIILYSVCAVVAFWFPFAVAVFVAITWLAWLIIGINIKAD